ncbi:MAG TPA: translation initiation factor IF-2 [Candidatus Saccharimonadales bacterium]|jgi:translation initiation factor IF-2|nr:translation initiation factor IF-2 [Candidatus Saccharimonadales bacterium]
MSSKIAIDGSITVGALAEKLMIPVTKLITELMKLGVMVTVNERIDFDTAQIIVQELGLEIELEKIVHEEINLKTVKTKLENHTAVPRPPIVAVMGHVDHGKTSLLDAIRGSSVAKGEAGGITQHISAYQVKHADRLITLLDTPGHEAFAALREHGAQLTDLVIIVVAVDDGVKPQTIEAIRFAKKAGVKIIVAINKIDKPGSDSNMVKQQLAEQGVLIEGWGGDVVAVEVSAKTKVGIDQLLDMVLLVADVEELDAYLDVPAYGLVIESHMEKGRGPVAELLVQGGILKASNFIVAGSTYARIRNLELTDGNKINEAKPSTPVTITGFKELPTFGDRFEVVDDEKTARILSSKAGNLKQTTKNQIDMNSSELIRLINHNNDVNELNIIVKADVQGSLVSVLDSLKALDTDEVAVRVIGSSVGIINENDIHLAQGGNAIIYGFNVELPKNIQQLAHRSDVKVQQYNIIYELIEDAKEEMSKLLAPEIIVNQVGILKVKGVFKSTKTSIICGGEVTKNKIISPALGKILRKKEILAEEVEITNLKRGPQDVKEVLEGEMCGLSIKTTNRVDLQIDDRIEVYTREVRERSI